MRFSKRSIARGVEAVLVLGVGGWSATAAAVDVELNPGYVAGSVGIAGVSLDSATVRGNSLEPDESGKYFDAQTNTAANGSYTLTVHTPVGGSMGYRVGAVGYSDSSRDYLEFPSSTVTVADGQISQLDIELVPGFIQGTVSLVGATLSYGYITAGQASGGEYLQANTSFGADGSFSFPVQPGQEISLGGYFTTTDGVQYALAARTVDLAAGATLQEDWNVELDQPGTVEGRVEVVGVADLDRYWIIGYGPNGSSKSISQRDTDLYTLGDLPAGSWQLRPTAYLNDGDDTYTYPYLLSYYGTGNALNVPAGGTITADLIAQGAFVKGNIALIGSKDFDDVASATIRAGGVYSSPSQGGSSLDNVNAGTGNFDLVLSDGEWEINKLFFRFNDPDPGHYLRSELELNDAALRGSYGGSLHLAGGQTLYHPGLNYATGTVTIRYTVEGGGELSYPEATAQRLTTGEDPATRINAFIRAYGLPDVTTEGEVVMVGIPGSYDLSAYGRVGGSRTEFGSMVVEIFPGTDVVQDIGGPDVSIDNPPPELYTDESTVEVSATVTDEDGIASVTVNGEEVELTSTNNPDDPNEVSFSTTVELEPGPNSIEMVVTDQVGKQSSDTRYVYLDDGPPTLAWTPEDGGTVGENLVTVSGIASDDNEVTRITVNGQPVSFVSTNNPDDPNEVAFSVTVTLEDEVTPVVVSVTDNCRRTTSETHTIGVVDNRPPVADAGPDQVVEQGSPEGAEVTLDGGGSSDPDGDSLGYLWSGAFGAVDGVMPTVTVPPGESEITLVVNDGSSDSQPDTVVIRVVDTTPPGFDYVQLVGELWPPNHKWVQVATVSGLADLADPDPQLLITVTADEAPDGEGDGNTGVDWKLEEVDGEWRILLRSERSGRLDGRSYTITVTATDAAGNVTTTTGSVSVPHDQRCKAGHGKDGEGHGRTGCDGRDGGSGKDHKDGRGGKDGGHGHDGEEGKGRDDGHGRDTGKGRGNGR